MRDTSMKQECETNVIFNLGVTLKGRVIRSNLFFVPQKSISTSIPNAKAA